MRTRWIVVLVMIGLLVMMGVDKSYAEGNKVQEKMKAKTERPSSGEKKQQNDTQWWGSGKGDNKDDSNSGKVDQIGDGNSGQGNDKKTTDKIQDRKDKKEDIRDRKEDRKDSREDIRDKREEKKDRRENIRDRREDRKDRREDIRDRRNDTGSGDGTDVSPISSTNKTDGSFVKHCPTCRCGAIRRPRGGDKRQTVTPVKKGEKGNQGVRDQGKGEGRDGVGQGKGSEGNKTDKPVIEKPSKENVEKDRSNEGVRDYGQGEGRDDAGQGKGQGEENKDKEKNK
ncbi:MAG: hypothetical protein WC980_00570 [Candidatus Brocadiia bacterium]